MKRLLLFVLVLLALSLANQPAQASSRIAGPSFTINPVAWVGTWTSNFVAWVEIIMTPPDPPTRPKNPAGGNSSWSKNKVQFGNVGSGHGDPTPPPPPTPNR